MTALPTSPIDRRRALALLGAGSATLLAACGSGSSSGGTAAGPTGDSTASTTAGTTGSPTASTTPGTAADTTADAAATPAETAGPFPADGTNGDGAGGVADVLSDPRSIRVDIRSDLDGTNIQDGAETTLNVRVVRSGTGDAVAGAAFYVWHCNREGEYSAYSSSMLGGDFSDRSFLRGVQVTDGDGRAAFTTILPGRYPGRAWHIHVEVYEDATYASRLLTTQMAIDDDTVDALYAQAGYSDSLRHDTDNAGDGVFADGVDHQLVSVTGDVASGLILGFTAAV